MSAFSASEESFRQQFGVSRETLARLSALHDLILKWSRGLNLVSRNSQDDLWHRHFTDSAQLWALRPAGLRRWVDLGAGAGFPGLVIAAIAASAEPDLSVTLVESDERKAVFLTEAGHRMGLTVDVIGARIESLDPLAADVLSARALAPLDVLLGYLQKHRSASGIGLFPKGVTVHNEIDVAALAWRFEPRLHPSATRPGAAIVEVGAVSRV